MTIVNIQDEFLRASITSVIRLCALMLWVSFTGCVSDLRVDAEDALNVSENVEVEYDSFRGLTFYHGPVLSNKAETASGFPEVEDVAIRAQQARDKQPRFFLTITDYYDGDWRGFDQAFDSSGKKFHALSVRHKVNCSLWCGYEESLEIELSRQYLEDHLKSGISMRLYGPAGQSSSPFTIPGPYLLGFLKGAFIQR